MTDELWFIGLFSFLLSSSLSASPAVFIFWHARLSGWGKSMTFGEFRAEWAGDRSGKFVLAFVLGFVPVAYVAWIGLLVAAAAVG